MKFPSQSAGPRFLWTAALLPLLALLALILWLKPWYGVMDDGVNLFYCEKIAAEGFRPAFLDFLGRDYGWGMIRPFYFVFVNLYYCPTAGLPGLLFTVNAFVVFALAAFLGLAFHGALPEKRWRRAWFIPAFVVVTLCTYRWHDMFIVASLQEKLVLLAGALALWLLRDIREGSTARNLADIAVIVLTLAIGFLTKAQFLLFLPGLFLLLLAREEKSKGWWTAKLAAFALASAAGTIVVKMIAAQGAYTSAGYSFAKMPANLMSRQSLILIAIAFVTLGIELYRARGLGSRAQVRALVPSSFLLSFLAILAPWSLGDSYILSTTAPLSAFCILSALQAWPEEKAWRFLIPAAVFALALTSYRGYRGLGRWSDYGKIIFSETLRERGREPLTIVMSCMEGHDLTRYYVGRFTEVKAELIRETAQAKNEKIVAIADSAFCPLPDAAGGRYEKISTPLFDGSFTLYELKR